jgi:glycosyltransferase involved in cell wall biosynthesis
VSLRVLVNAGPWLEVPPTGYGGIENVIAMLVPELRSLGAHVVLATIRTSTLEADDYIWTLDEPHLSEVAQPYNRTAGVAMAHMHAVTTALHERRATAVGHVDVVHDHLEVAGPAMFAAMGRAAPPVLQTLHWDLAKHAEFYRTFDGGGRIGFAAVSQAQLDRAPANLQRQTLGVVPLGAAPPEHIAPSTDDAHGVADPARRHGPALVLARITRDKAQDAAIRVCRDAGVPLVLAGPVAGIDDPDELYCRLRDPSDPVHTHPDLAYFCADVAPHLDGDAVRWVGAVSGDAKERLFAGARALLAPVRWCEPGATAVVEALTRGVPVVATPRGAHGSLVDHGTTGFLAEDEHALARHLSEVDRIDPEECRRAASRWTPHEMARSYLRLYEQLLDRAGRRASTS